MDGLISRIVKKKGGFMDGMRMGVFRIHFDKDVKEGKG